MYVAIQNNTYQKSIKSFVRTVKKKVGQLIELKEIKSILKEDHMINQVLRIQELCAEKHVEVLSKELE